MVFAPILALLVSTAVMLVNDGVLLTGRGLIYEQIRASFQRNWLFGSGPNTLIDAFEGRSISFLAFHAHGVAPSLLDNYGLVVFLLFAAALAARGVILWRLPPPDWRALILPFALVAVTFPTETTFKIDVISFPVWAALLFFSRDPKSSNLVSSNTKLQQTTRESSNSQREFQKNVDLRTGEITGN